eukprot:COSAG01_NODE_1195_length_11304_cov_118.555823_5_plen_97_part_00
MARKGGGWGHAHQRRSTLALARPLHAGRAVAPGAALQCIPEKTVARVHLGQLGASVEHFCQLGGACCRWSARPSFSYRTSATSFCTYSTLSCTSLR